MTSAEIRGEQSMTHDEMEQRITDLLWRITGANDCFLLYRHLLESRKDHLDKGFQTPGKMMKRFPSHLAR